MGFSAGAIICAWVMKMSLARKNRKMREAEDGTGSFYVSTALAGSPFHKKTPLEMALTDRILTRFNKPRSFSRESSHLILINFYAQAGARQRVDVPVLDIPDLRVEGSSPEWRNPDAGAQWGLMLAPGYFGKAANQDNVRD
ncbi:mandelate racemase/muconate lactonizing protein-like protein [Zalerion maritima]|uniref:Mandelate racemase/muconate lactonizing protein-like protein n=1 Tax=Zalerion maritima TaxID=339359 RepID=A0AAD5RNJ9_9PEZI|nr:mandelate racemase/muconate lactonizing protein-like protein [Zalerion maritima]